MINSRIYNVSQKRKATAREIAKYLLVEEMEGAFYDVNQKFGVEDLTDEQYDEIRTFVNKYFNSLRKRLNPNNNIQYV